MSLSLLMVCALICLLSAAQALCAGKPVACFWFTNLLRRRRTDSVGIWLDSTALSQLAVCTDVISIGAVCKFEFVAESSKGAAV